VDVLKLDDVKLEKKDKNGNNKEILKGISFSLSENKAISILGPSGSGKTSLLRLINRLEDPTSGKIFYKDRPLKEYDVIELRSKISLIWQSPVVFKNSVTEELSFALKLCDKNINLDEKRLLDTANLLGFGKYFLDMNPQKMSVGEKQRLSIIRTLTIKPEILLIDEPTSALDIHSKDKVAKLFKDSLQNDIQGIIIITHDISLAREISEYGLIIADGEIQNRGNIEEIIKIWQKKYKTE